MSHETYLGDGVYVSIERRTVRLTTRDDGKLNIIYLELPVVSNLMDYLKSRIQITDYARPGEHIDAVIRTAPKKED